MVAIALGILFEKQNIAFMVGLAFAVAASANFPVLFLSILWKGMTTRGAVIGGFLGLISSVVLTVLSPSVWEATLGNPKGSAPFPYTSPALFSMTLAFLGIWLFSVTDKSRRAAIDKAGYLAQATGNALHARGVERQAVNKGLGHAAFAAGLNILLVGSKDVIGVGNEIFGCALQDFILARRGQLRHDGRDFLGSTGFGQNFFAFSVAHVIPE